MPCRDDDYCDDRSERLDEVTDMLCTVLKLNPTAKITAKIERWWKSHQEDDRRREAADVRARRKLELRKKAISKLTGEERLALGI